MMSLRNLHIAFVSHIFQFDKTPEELLQEYFTMVEWATAIARQGVKVSVVQRYVKTQTLVKDEVNYYFIADGQVSRPNSSPMGFYKNVQQFVLKEQVDVIHLHDIRNTLMNMKLKRLFKNIPKVIQDHGSVFRINSWKDHLLKPFLRYGLRHMDRVMFAAKGQEENWTKHQVIEESQCVFVMENSSPFAYSDRDTARAITKLQGAPVFLWVGNLNTNKDPFTVLRAFKKLLQNYPGARLYMIYRFADLEQEVKQWITNESLKVQVVLLGRQDRNKLQHYYNSVDYFISASYKEGSGYAAIEAMSCGVVPILTHIPSFISLTKAGDVGTLFEPGNSEMLYQKICSLLDKPLTQERGRVLNHFNQYFSFEAIAKQAIEVYQEVTSQSRGDGR